MTQVLLKPPIHSAKTVIKPPFCFIEIESLFRSNLAVFSTFLLWVHHGNNTFISSPKAVCVLVVTAFQVSVCFMSSELAGAARPSRAQGTPRRPASPSPSRPRVNARRRASLACSPAQVFSFRYNDSDDRY